MGRESNVQVMVGRGDPVATHFKERRSPGRRMCFSLFDREKVSFSFTLLLLLMMTSSREDVWPEDEVTVKVQQKR